MAITLQAASILITNGLPVVSLVALPGMMAGQIISGVSQLLAVRYHILIMCMVYGSSGITTAYLLTHWPALKLTPRL